MQFGIKTVIVGESKTFLGTQDFMESQGVQVIDLDLAECKQLMRDFIEKIRCSGTKTLASCSVFYCPKHHANGIAGWDKSDISTAWVSASSTSAA